MAVNLLFIGELDLHEMDFLPFLAEHGYNITVINTSCISLEFPQTIIGTDIPVYHLYENSRIRFVFKGSVARAWMLKALSGGIVERLGFTFPGIGRVFKEKEIELVYGSWGSIGLPELRSIKKFNVPVVYEFLTYPAGFSETAEKIENFFNKSIINSLAGLVFASPTMLNYMENIFGLHQRNKLVFPESYSKRCFYQKRLPLLSDDDGEPHLVFIGVSYDIFPQIEEILRKRIHVHLCETASIKNRLRKSRFKNFCHVFRKTGVGALFDGSFATFLTQFDACLVTYDLRRATGARLSNSVPNRFSFALAAGIPIALPRGYFKSCEDIVNRHQIGFAYLNCDELKNKLNNRDLMDDYRHNTRAKSHIFTLEDNFDKIDKFLRRVARP